MTDDRPRPKYGEYAPLPPAGHVPPPVTVAPPEFAPPRAGRPPWDVLVTTALLLVGVFDVVTRYSQFADLAPALEAAYTAQGIGTFTALAAAAQMGAVINAIRIAILVATIVVTLLVMRAGRRAFWIPLVGGAFALLAVLACVIIVIVQDPSFLAYVEQNSTQ